MPFYGTVKGTQRALEMMDVGRRIQEGTGTAKDQEAALDYMIGQQQDRTWGAAVSDSMMSLPKYAVEWAATGGALAGAGLIAKEGAKKAAKWAVAKRLGRELVMRSATWGGAHAVEEAAGVALRSANPHLSVSELGDMEVAFDQSMDSFFDALPEGYRRAIYETASEMSGAAAGPAFGAAVPYVAKMFQAEIFKKMGAAAGKAFPTRLNALMKKTGWHGPVTEYGEEVFGGVLRALDPGMEEGAEDIVPGFAGGGGIEGALYEGSAMMIGFGLFGGAMRAIGGRGGSSGSPLGSEDGLESTVAGPGEAISKQDPDLESGSTLAPIPDAKGSQLGQPETVEIPKPRDVGQTFADDKFDESGARDTELEFEAPDGTTFYVRGDDKDGWFAQDDRGRIPNRMFDTAEHARDWLSKEHPAPTEEAAEVGTELDLEVEAVAPGGKIVEPKEGEQSRMAGLAKTRLGTDVHFVEGMKPGVAGASLADGRVLISSDAAPDDQIEYLVGHELRHDLARALDKTSSTKLSTEGAQDLADRISAIAPAEVKAAVKKYRKRRGRGGKPLSAEQWQEEAQATMMGELFPVMEALRTEEGRALQKRVRGDAKLWERIVDGLVRVVKGTRGVAARKKARTVEALGGLKALSGVESNEAEVQVAAVFNDAMGIVERARREKYIAQEFDGPRVAKAKEVAASDARKKAREKQFADAEARAGRKAKRAERIKEEHRGEIQEAIDAPEWEMPKRVAGAPRTAIEVIQQHGGIRTGDTPLGLELWTVMGPKARGGRAGYPTKFLLAPDTKSKRGVTADEAAIILAVEGFEVDLDDQTINKAVSHDQMSEWFEDELNGNPKLIPELEDLKAAHEGARTANIEGEAVFWEPGESQLTEEGIDEFGDGPVDQDAFEAWDERFEQAAPVDSPAFKRWFGESKVVDAEGNPLVVFHGTPDARDLTEFRTPLEAMTRARRDPNFIDPEARYYFTSSPEVADSYADFERAWDRDKADPATLPMYLRLLDPVEINGRGRQWRSLVPLIESAKASGLDGAIIRNVRDAYPTDGPVSDVFVVFDPKHIKSATGNRGTFDPGDADIRHEQTAFHASPHEFDKFSTESIGTGEEAQDFGWGLYFASRRSVAEWYRRKLGGKRAAYQVELAPSDSEWLMWDVPLRDQSEIVKSGVASLLDSHPSRLELDLDATGGEFYDSATAAVEPFMSAGAAGVLSAEDGQQITSTMLLGVGIRGVKYLDGGSRSDGVGTYNFVVFDDADVDISARFEQTEPDVGEVRRKHAIGSRGHRKLQGVGKTESERALSDAIVGEMEDRGAPGRESIEEMGRIARELVSEDPEGVKKMLIDAGATGAPLDHIEQMAGKLLAEQAVKRALGAKTQEESRKNHEIAVRVGNAFRQVRTATGRALGMIRDDRPAWARSAQEKLAEALYTLPTTARARLKRLEKKLYEERQKAKETERTDAQQKEIDELREALAESKAKQEADQAEIDKLEEELAAPAPEVAPKPGVWARVRSKLKDAKARLKRELGLSDDLDIRLENLLFEGDEAHRREMKRLEGQIQSIVDKDAERSRQAIQALHEKGLDPSALTNEDMLDPEVVSEVAQTINSNRFGKWDWFVVWRLNAMLTAPSTHVRNIGGNAVNLALELGARRTAEAVVAGIGRKLTGRQLERSASWAEFKVMGPAMLKSLPIAYRNAVSAMKTGMPGTESWMLKQEMEVGDVRSKIEVREISKVPSKYFAGFDYLGFRALEAGDALFKTTAFITEHAALSYRAAKQEVEPGEDLMTRFGLIMEDPGHPVVEQAYQNSLYMVFQGPSDKFENAAMTLRDWLNSHELGVPVGWMMLPFIGTPWKIFKAALRITPYEILKFAGSTTFKARAGKLSDEELVREFADAMLAAGVFWAVYAMVGGGGDDEPLITGSPEAWGGRRDLQSRTAPALSVKIGGQYVSYAGYEPIAMSIGVMVDAVSAWKDAANDGNAEAMGAASAKVTSSIWQQMGDKSFLRTIGDLQRLTSGRKSMPTFARDMIVTPMVPNVIRGGLRYGDTVFRQNEAREMEGVSAWRQMFKTLPYAMLPAKDASWTPPPRRDVWGQPIKRQGDALIPWDIVGRHLPIFRLTKTDPTLAADLAMRRWNRAVEMGHAEGDPLYPRAPAYSSGSKDNKVIWTSAEYDELTRRSGEMAMHRASRLDFDFLEGDEMPSPRLIESLRKIFRDSKRIATLQMRQQRNSR